MSFLTSGVKSNRTGELPLNRGLKRHRPEGRPCIYTDTNSSTRRSVQQGHSPHEDNFQPTLLTRSACVETFHSLVTWVAEVRTDACVRSERPGMKVT